MFTKKVERPLPMDRVRSVEVLNGRAMEAALRSEFRSAGPAANENLDAKPRDKHVLLEYSRNFRRIILSLIRISFCRSGDTNRS